jgi:hypothetical protein
MVVIAAEEGVPFSFSHHLIKPQIYSPKNLMSYIFPEMIYIIHTSGSRNKML